MNTNLVNFTFQHFPLLVNGTGKYICIDVERNVEHKEILHYIETCIT